MKNTRIKTTHLLLAALAPLVVCSTTLAIQPQQWSHTTEADFAGGDPFGTVITNLGDIRLSSDTTTLEGLPEGVTHIYDMVTIGDATYIAAGPTPGAVILKLSDGDIEVIAELENEQVFALDVVNGELMVAVSSENSRLAVLNDNGEWGTIAEFEGVRYIWDTLTAGLMVFAATGPEGKVLYTIRDAHPEMTIARGDAISVILDAAQANILTLAMGPDGAIYAGTDTDGLVYRLTEIDVDSATWEPFVLYDAPEAEIGALVVMDDGTVYAGTAAADQARPGRLAQPVAAEQGRPEEPEVEPEMEPEPEPAPEAEPEEEVEAEEQVQADPTAEDYDRLREALRERLRIARESGELGGNLDAGGNAGAGVAGGGNQRASRAQAASPSGGNKPGNAVYRIDPQGFVSEVFRESAMILAIALDDDGNLLVATGNEGQVFRVDPDLRETTVLADLDSQMVPTLSVTDDGILVGGASPASLTLLSDQLAMTGQFTSQVLDAGQVSMFGTFKLTADIPAGCSVLVETRTGNVGDPELAAWSQWQQAGTLEHDANIHALQPREIAADNAPARYLQYRLTLNGTGSETPVVDQVALAYVSPNMPPQIASLTINTPAAGAPGTDHNTKLTAQWQATDDNGDRVVYDLEYRPAGSDVFLPLASDLTTTNYEWATQHVPDGWYTLRVTADDRLDNPGDMAMTGRRLSDAVLVDNTPPSLGDLEAVVDAQGILTLTATAGDALCAISSIGYSVDGSDEYAASLPNDLIYDSTSEPWSVTIPDLSPGGHVVALRIIDARGNTAYRQVIVTIE